MANNIEERQPPPPPNPGGTLTPLPYSKPCSAALYNPILDLTPSPRLTEYQSLVSR